MWSESSCAFPKNGTATGSRRALEQWRPTARQKRSYLYHQSEFQHNYFDFVSLHHSDHDGVVRIFVGHSEIVKRLLITLFTRHNFSYTRSVIMTLTKGNWGREEGREGTKVGCVTKGGPGGPPPE